MVVGIHCSHLLRKNISLALLSSIRVLVIEGTNASNAEASDLQTEAARVPGLLSAEPSNETPNLLNWGVDVTGDRNVVDGILVGHLGLDFIVSVVSLVWRGCH